jgi:hypothetical protein
MLKPKKFLKKELKAARAEVQELTHEVDRLDGDREDLIELLSLQAHQIRVMSGTMDIHLRNYGVSLT